MFHNFTKCEMCGILLHSMLVHLLLPTKIVGLEAFEWSDRLKVCYSGKKLQLILVSIFPAIKLITNTGRCEQIYLIYTFKIHHILVQCKRSQRLIIDHIACIK